MPVCTRAAALSLGLGARSTTQEDGGKPPLPAVVSPDVSTSKRRYSQSTPTSAGTAATPKRPRRSPSKKIKPKTSVAVPFRPPSDWRNTYELVRELRQDRTAPCDHSGCEALMDLATDPKRRRFYALVALMLSSQTKDAVVANAMQRLHDDGVLSVDGILDLARSALSDDYLYSVGFRNNKAKYLQEACQILKDTYDGDIPPTASAMMELPGVGPKMAYICENAAWDQQSGIGVDTHMHRLFPLLGWVPKAQAKTPEHTRQVLEAWLPVEYWKDVNLLWVGFGQEVQQQPDKMLRKALECSRPLQAVQLLQRCGMKCRRVATRHGLEEQYDSVMAKAKRQD